MPVRILLIADTHLGFDHPVAPRVRRRRRGHDFLANYLRALEPARAGEVDLVVHALIHVFHGPRTVGLEVRGTRVALFGFPYERGDVRLRVRDLVEETGWRPGEHDVSLLCVHHCFQGAAVGPAGFTFRHGPDVIRVGDIPAGVAAVLTGHVHRHQVLTTDLAGRPLPAPILYPGSVERTAFAEMGEAKGFMTVEVASVPEDAVLRLRVRGPLSLSARALLAAEPLRRLVPPEMNVEVVEVSPLISPRPRRERPCRPPRPARLRDGVIGTLPARLPAASRGPEPGVSPHAAPAPPVPSYP